MVQPPEETTQPNQQAKSREGGGASRHPGPVGAGSQTDLGGHGVDTVVGGDPTASTGVHRLSGLQLCRCVPVRVGIGGGVAVGGRRRHVQW